MINDIFISHLHADHFADLPYMYPFRAFTGGFKPLRVYGPSGRTPELGTKAMVANMCKMNRWHEENFDSCPIGDGFEIEVTEFDWKERNGICYDKDGVKVRHWPHSHMKDGASAYRLDWEEAGLSFVWTGIGGARRAAAKHHRISNPAPAPRTEDIQIPGRKAIPVTLLTGFLGSGKTTLLNRILSGSHGLRIGVLVNDFGAINIDAELVEGVEENTYNLANGCICCEIRDDLVQSLEELLARADQIDYVIVEASGVSDPEGIVMTFLDRRYRKLLRLDSITCIVDAEAIFSQAEDEELTGLTLWKANTQALSFPGKTSTPSMVPSTRRYQAIERAAALPMATASSRIFFIRASGLNGFPSFRTALPQDPKQGRDRPVRVSPSDALR